MAAGGPAVIGIGEAAFHVASLVSEYFTVITTLERSVNAIRNNLLRYGLGSRCVNVIASEIPVLELEKYSTKSKKIISELITRAKREDSAGAIVLGCAGMGDFAQELSAADKVMLLDIYPAREVPIKGVTSQALLDKITCKQKGLYARSKFPEAIVKTEVLLTLGAGDIGSLSLQLYETYSEAIH